MELRNCHKAEIYDLSDTLICEAEVTRASYDGYRLVVPSEFELHEKTEQFNVVFFDGVAGLIHTLCVLGDELNINRGQKSLLCMVREEKGNEQRRSDLKIPAEVSIEVSCVRRAVEPEEEEQAEAEAAVVTPASKQKDMKRLPARIPSRTQNISAGGVYFICEYKIPRGSHIQFQLHEAAKPLLLTAEILRRDELEPLRNGTPQFGHGCKFINMKSQTEAELRSYIFRKELEIRKRSRR